MNDENIRFGSVNTETGEVQDGYIDKDGQMKFKPQKWWQKLFQKRPEEKEYIGFYNARHKWLWSSDWYSFKIPLYKYYNPLNQEIYKIEGENCGHKIQLDIEAYKRGQIVALKIY